MIHSVKLFAVLLFTACCTSAATQKGWYFESSAGNAGTGTGSLVNTASLTVGHSTGKNRIFRVDVVGLYINSGINSRLMVAPVFTLGEHRNMQRVTVNVSFGAGIGKVRNKAGVDYLMPWKANIGYRTGNHLTMGIQSIYIFDLLHFRRGSFGCVGLFVGIRL